MASSGVSIIVLILVFTQCGGASAQSPSTCTNTLVSLSPCLNYVTGNSSTPSSSCCSQLASVVQTSPNCLCQVLNATGASLGFTFNRTLALSLPGACKVQTPPISQCKAATAPAIPPAASPVISSPPKISPARSPEEATATSPTEASNGTPEPTSSPGEATATAPTEASNETPEPTTNDTPATASQVPSSAGTGFKTVPSTTATSSGSIVKAPIHFVLFVFFVVLCGSILTKF